MTEEKFKEILEQLENHENRIHEIEKSISINNSGQKPEKLGMGKNRYTGPTGGLRLLIKDGFFKSKKDLVSVRKELESKNYYYSRQAIHEALKASSKPGAPLVALKEEGKRVYVERK